MAAFIARKPDEPIRIVIADDHRIVREGLRSLLQTQPDFRVLGEGTNGQKAVELVARLKPDVLVLGISTADSPGFDALRELAADFSAVRPILLAGAIDRADIVKALQLGARGVVLKDSPAELLYKSIRTVMSGQYWVGREIVSDLLATLRDLSTRDSTREVENFGLTSRQLEIVTHVVSGLTNKEIAKRLSISEQTVKHHVSLIFDKTGVSSRLELAMFAARHRLLAPA